MSWFDVDLSLTTFFTPIPDDQTVCAEANGARVCVPFRGRPISQAVGGTLGGSYVLANDAETLGGILRLHALGGAGNRHWQVGGGGSAGFLAAFDAVDFSIEAGYDVTYLSSTGEAELSEVLHTLSAGFSIGGRITPLLKVFVAPRVLIPFGGDDGVRTDAIAVELSVGVDFSLQRKPVPKEVVTRTPDPDEEARAATVRAALAEAQIRLERARAHLEPGWLASHLEAQVKQTSWKPTVAVEIDALRDCASWIQQPDRQWASAERLSMNSLRGAIAQSVQTVLAGPASTPQRKAAGAVLEASDTIARDTATMLAARLEPEGQASLLPRLIAWGRDLKAAIGKLSNGDPAEIETQLLYYGHAILAYQDTIGAVMPLLPKDSVTLQDTLGAVTCLHAADPACKDRFSRLFTEAYDPSITALELSNQLDRKRKR